MKRQKFNSLLAEHQKRVFSLALYILGDQTEAEDITQEVFISLWNKLNELEVGIEQK